MKSLYEILGVAKNSSTIVIKEAFKKLAMEHHPDKGGDADEFIKVQQAYEILSDPKSRKLYDETGFIPNMNEESMIISKAKNNLIQALRGIITSQPFAMNPDRFDIMGTMRKLVTDNKDNITGMLNQKNKQIKLTQKVLKKLTKKTKTESSFLHDSINSMISEIQSEINQITLDLKTIDIMSELIQEYSYDVSMEQMMNSLSGMLNGTSTSTFTTSTYRF